MNRARREMMQRSPYRQRLTVTLGAFTLWLCAVFVVATNSFASDQKYGSQASAAKTAPRPGAAWGPKLQAAGRSGPEAVRATGRPAVEAFARAPANEKRVPLARLDFNAAHAGQRPTAVGPGEVELGHSQYEPIRDTALAVITKLNGHLPRSDLASRELIVGVGRSPTPVIAALQEMLGERAAVNFPGSLRGITVNGKTVPTDPAQAAQALFANPATRAHLQRFLPAELIKGRERITLTDYTVSGRSLSVAAHLVRLHVATISPATRVEELGLSRSGGPNRVAIGPAMLLGGPRYDELAEFGSAKMGDGLQGAQLPRNAEYDRLRATLRARLEVDPHVATQLNRPSGPAQAGQRSGGQTLQASP